MVKKNLKIAFMIDGFPVISETFILNQITGLLDRGHQIEIFPKYRTKPDVVHADIQKYDLMNRTRFVSDIVPSGKAAKLVSAAKLFWNHIGNHPLPVLRSLNVFRYGRNALTLKYFFYTVSLLKTDIIYCHFGINGRDYVFLKEIFEGKVQFITTFHGYDLTKAEYFNGDSYRELFKRGDLFLPISRNWKNKLVTLGCDPDRIVVHHMGIDLDRFALHESNGKGGDIRILTVARLVEKKGLEYSIRAVAKLVGRYPRLRYTIAGDGPLAQSLKNLIVDLGMSQHIQLAGPLSSDSISELMKKAHIYILASVTAEDGDQEGIPVSLMEAMAVGLPVISTVHSGIPELIVDGRSGFLVPERDVDALVNKCEVLLKNPKQCIEMGREGRQSVEKEFNIRKLNQKLEEIFCEYRVSH